MKNRLTPVAAVEVVHAAYQPKPVKSRILDY
jgi:hypothetical protein